MKPYYNEALKLWVCQYRGKSATNGKREVRYFKTEEDAQADIDGRQKERDEHGRSAVSAQERQWILFARNQLDGDLSKLPDVLSHWKSTGPGSITPTTVKDAVKAFEPLAYQRVSLRTQADIRYRLKAFSEAFSGRCIHSIHTSEIEVWISSFQNPGQAAAMRKRIGPLFKFAVRHRMIAVNPLDSLERVRPAKVARRVYTPEQFKSMLEWAQAKSFWVMLPYLAISGLCFTRTSELVRTFSPEEVLRWSDFLTKRNLLHIRAEVSKTRERFVPYGDTLERLIHTHLGVMREGRVIETMQSSFNVTWRKMHSDLKLGKPIPNGMRKSCISHKLAAEPEVGIVQCARWSGNSESVVKRHYWEAISEEDGEKWFDLPVIF